MRRIFWTATVIALLVTTASTTASATVRHSASFKVPSGNVGCLFNSGKLRCDILSGLKPEPQKACKFFWKGVMLPASGRASYLCIIDTVYNDQAPTLHFGSTWKRDGIVCRSRTIGLRCNNQYGHGFFLSRARSTKW